MKTNSKHKLSERVKIYWTNNYSLFSFVKGNRDISEKKMKKIEESINSGLNLLPHCPIVVSEKMKIIDGQHRFMVCKKMKLPIYYVIAENIEIRDIATLNSNTDKWKQKDFIFCYIDLGIEDYKKLHEFKEKYPFSYSVSASILAEEKINDGGSNLTEDIQEGRFKVENFDKSIEFANKYILLSDYAEKIIDRKLISAMQRLYKN